MIYHIASKHEWEQQLHHGEYAPTGFLSEGFIHLSTKLQVQGVLDRYYKGVKDLILLHVDESKLGAELKYETSTNNELYPHLFGKLNTDAVVKVEFIS